MTSCLDDDALVSLGSALDWDGEVLQHLLQCADCKEQLRQLSAVRQIVDITAGPRPAFMQEVMIQLHGSELMTERRTGSASQWIQLLNPLLAAVTALGVIQMAAAGSRLPIGPQVIIMPVVVAVTTWWWNRKQGVKAQVI